ncbi:MAG: hypothetical protein ACX936_21245 [Marinobacter sp.]
MREVSTHQFAVSVVGVHGEAIRKSRNAGGQTGFVDERESHK